MPEKCNKKVKYRLSLVYDNKLNFNICYCHHFRIHYLPVFNYLNFWDGVKEPAPLGALKDYRLGRQGA